MDCNLFVRETKRLTKERAKELVAEGIRRAVRRHGKADVALAGGCSPRCIEKALAFETAPGIDTLANILDLEPTVLDEVLASRGYRLAPLTADAANDLATSASLSEISGAIQRALVDGIRDHSETLVIADQIRPVMPALSAIIGEANRLKGAA